MTEPHQNNLGRG